MNLSIEKRLRNLEAKQAPTDTLLSSVRLIGNREDELDRQIAAMTAAGVIQPQTPVICRLLVSPDRRRENND